jgi:hypothetical protein
VTKTFAVVVNVMLITAIALTAAISVFSYLAGVIAATPKCAGLAWVEGYYNGTFEMFFGLPLGALWMVVPMGIVALGKSQRVKHLLDAYNLPVFEFASMRVTFGEYIIYRTFLVMLVILGAMTGVSRYNAIVKYCLAAAAHKYIGDAY